VSLTSKPYFRLADQLISDGYRLFLATDNLLTMRLMQGRYGSFCADSPGVGFEAIDSRERPWSVIDPSQPIPPKDRRYKKRAWPHRSPVRRKTMSIIDKALEANLNYAKSYDPKLGGRPAPKSQS
jgi:hypothetical protein